MDETWLLESVKRVIVLILSLSVHEWAHAMSAYKLGDDTAARQGRLTLDPTSHIDPIGTLLVPLLISFGWARPVPFVATNFDRKWSMRTAEMLTSAAGPASNVVLAMICATLAGVMIRFGWGNQAIWEFLNLGFTLNMILAFFNMLPLPPLDGARVADSLMPYRFRPAWESFAAKGPMILLLLIASSFVTGISIFRLPLRIADGIAQWWVMMIATL